ncbi:MAG: S-layer homology domain-containing protein, partial [Clostridia bacterium]|nr:S-layer homology domain-containing protein [Clostridia bacterium]
MKKFLALVLSVIMLSGAAVSVMADESPFTDVKTSRWSYDAIRYAVDKVYMNGVGGGKFDPAGPMTRGMVVTVVYRREGSPEVTFRGDFTDVRAGKYYSDAVIWAKDEGVVNGITETTFEPDGKITREQLATMLSRFSERCPVSVPERADLSGYPDADKIHSYAKDALGWANEANLIKGMSDGTLSPRGNATREQFAAILKRFDDTFTLVYNEPVQRSHYTEPEYPLVDDADVYVATDGDDSNPGTFDKPVATFNRAVELVREIKAAKTSGDIVVAFKAGDYGPLSVTLAAEDSGAENQRIVYCKYGDGDVIFNNGFDVSEDEFRPLGEEDKELFPSKNADKIKKADISGKLKDYDPGKCMIISETGAMNVARFPNVYPDGSDNLVQAGVAYDHEHIHVTHTLFKNRIKKYHSVDGLILYGYIAAGWYKDMLETDGYTVEGEDEDFVFYLPHPENVYWGYGPQLGEGFATDYFQMAILNVSDELDAPGEFWIDEENGTFYVYEPSGDYSFPAGSGMITMGKVRNITFLGLDFKNSEDYIISAVEHPRDLTIDRCTFTGCAAQNMIDVRGKERGVPLDLLVTGCSFSTCACTALWVDSVNMD